MSFNMSLLICPCVLISQCIIRNSVSDVDLFLFYSTCGISPRRPRTLLPHSPSPPRALSPSGTGKLKFSFIAYVMFCAIWYHLCNASHIFKSGYLYHKSGFHYSHFISHKAKGRISKRVFQENKVRQTFLTPTSPP